MAPPPLGALDVDLTARLGGPVGRHARREGRWFDPLRWSVLAAAITWLLLLLRHQPCEQYVAGQPVNAFPRLCYSDIPLAYQNSALGTGGLPYRDVATGQPPLTGLFQLVGRELARAFGAYPHRGVSAQHLVDGTHLFFLATALLLFCCFLAAVCCLVLMGRGSARGVDGRLGGRARSWDAMLFAASPAVFCAGLVGWDMFTVSLAVAALLAWSLRRQVLAGVLFGCAVAAGFWPVLLLLALLLLCRRAGLVAAWGRTALVALVVWAALSLPVLRVGVGAWTAFFTTWGDRGPDLGSLWFVLDAVGVSIPALSLLVLVLFVAWLVFVANLVRRAPRRPRVGQVAFLLVAGWLLVDKGYTPQHVLWLAPLVVLARPAVADWALWSVAEVLYWWAVWGHLGGQLSPGDGSPDAVYWAAIVFRVLVLGWLVSQVVVDVRHPWEDPVRAPLVDDPIGGVLDHAADRDERFDEDATLSLLDQPEPATP